MVAIFTGLGAGFERGSANILGGAGQVGSSLLGRANESVSVNAFNGNLLITNQDEFLIGRGPDAAISRTFNSIEDTGDGDNLDHWQQSSTKRLLGVPTGGALNQAGSTIQRLSGDGSLITYTWNGTRGAYLTTDGAGAHDTLKFVGGVWIWTDGDTQTTETYQDLDTGSGDWRIVQRADTNGNTLSFAYTGTALQKITNANGEWVRYHYNLQGRIDRIETGSGANAITLTRTHYSYYNNGTGPLQRVTTDLSPDDSSIAGGGTYWVEYGYDGAGLVNLITQTDGSRLEIEYYAAGHAQAGKVWKLIQTVSAGVIRTTMLEYGLSDANGTYTKIVGPDLAETRLHVDANGQLKRITAPAAGGVSQTVSFTYDGKGNVLSVTDGNGKTTNYVYDENYFAGAGDQSGTNDANGNVTLVTDQTTNTVTRWYDAENRLMTEMAWGSDESTAETSPAAANAQHYAQYAYDAVTGLLRFAVNASGQVTEYRYTANGELARTISYSANAYPVSSSTITEAGMVSWVAGLGNLSSVKVSENTYDARGNLQSTVSYSEADAAGNPITTSQKTQVDYIYDQAGQLLQRQSGNGTAETFLYDGLGRVYRSTNSAGGITQIEFQDASTKTIVTSAHGYTTTSTYNKSGELIATTGSGNFDMPTASSYKYDSAGRLRMVTTGHFQNPDLSVNTDLRNSYILYDNAGRKIADVNHLGEITEYRYDQAGRLVASIAYAARLGAAGMDELDGSGFAAGLPSQWPSANDPDNIWTWTVYDDAGRVLQVIDDLGSTVTHAYDKSGRLVRTTEWKARLDAIQLAQFKTATPTVVTLPAVDGNEIVTRYFYNKAGQAVGVLDGEGYLSETVYDSAGYAIRTIRYATATNPTHRATGSFATLKSGVTGSPTTDRVAYSVYDAQGLLRYTVNALGEVVGFTYDTAGRLTATTAHATAIVTTDLSYAAVKALVAVNAADRTSYTVYDGAGRAAYAIDAEGGVSAFSYDQQGNVTKAVAFAERFTSAGSPALSTMDSWATAQASNGQNRVTRNFYGDGGTLRFTLDPENYITYYNYDSALRVIEVRRYTDKFTTIPAVISTETLGTNYVFPNANFVSTFQSYDGAGRLDTATDGEGSITKSAYDALGRLSTVTAAYGTGLAVTTRYEYDDADRVTKQHLADGTADAATIEYQYDGLGDRTKVIDANGNQTTFVYDKLGRVKSSIDALNGETSFDYDAFGNVLRRTDPLLKATYNYYDRLNRLILVRDAEDYVTATAYNSFGEVSQIDQYPTALAAAPVLGVLPSLTGAGAPVVAGKYYYDHLGRAILSVDAEGYVNVTQYNAFGQVKSFSRYENTSIGLTPAGASQAEIDAAFAAAAAAQSTADAGQAAATQAQIAADSASAAAVSLQNAANAEQTIANGVQAIADQAAADAASAQSDADAAQAIADTAWDYLASLTGPSPAAIEAALDAAEALQANADALQTAADTAAASASAAQAAAAAALTAYNSAVANAAAKQTAYNNAVAAAAAAQSAYNTASQEAADALAAKNAATTTYNNAAAAVTTQQATVNTYASQLAAHTLTQYHANPITYLQHAVNAFNGMGQGYGISYSYSGNPADLQLSQAYYAAAQGAQVELTSVQAGNPLSTAGANYINQYLVEASGSGITTQQVNEYNTLKSNHTTAVATLATLQTQKTAAQNALNAATTLHTQKEAAKTTALNAKNAADAAVTTANTQLQSANSAVTTALNAKNAADSTAASAAAAATAAQAAADAAQADADEAWDEYDALLASGGSGQGGGDPQAIAAALAAAEAAQADADAAQSAAGQAAAAAQAAQAGADTAQAAADAALAYLQSLQGSDPAEVAAANAAAAQAQQEADGLDAQADAAEAAAAAAQTAANSAAAAAAAADVLVDGIEDEVANYIVSSGGLEAERSAALSNAAAWMDAREAWLDDANATVDILDNGTTGVKQTDLGYHRARYQYEEQLAGYLSSSNRNSYINKYYDSLIWQANNLGSDRSAALADPMTWLTTREQDLKNWIENYSTISGGSSYLTNTLNRFRSLWVQVRAAIYDLANNSYSSGWPTTTAAINSFYTSGKNNPSFVPSGVYYVATNPTHRANIVINDFFDVAEAVGEPLGQSDPAYQALLARLAGAQAASSAAGAANVAAQAALTAASSVAIQARSAADDAQDEADDLLAFADQLAISGDPAEVAAAYAAATQAQDRADDLDAQADAAEAAATAAQGAAASAAALALAADDLVDDIEDEIANYSGGGAVGFEAERAVALGNIAGWADTREIWLNDAKNGVDLIQSSSTGLHYTILGSHRVVYHYEGSFLYMTSGSSTLTAYINEYYDNISWRANNLGASRSGALADRLAWLTAREQDLKNWIDGYTSVSSSLMMTEAVDQLKRLWVHVRGAIYDINHNTYSTGWPTSDATVNTFYSSGKNDGSFVPSGITSSGTYSSTYRADAVINAYFDVAEAVGEPLGVVDPAYQALLGDLANAQAAAGTAAAASGAAAGALTAANSFAVLARAAADDAQDEADDLLAYANQLAAGGGDPQAIAAATTAANAAQAAADAAQLAADQAAATAQAAQDDADDAQAAADAAWDAYDAVVAGSGDPQAIAAATAAAEAAQAAADALQLIADQAAAAAAAAQGDADDAQALVASKQALADAAQLAADLAQDDADAAVAAAGLAQANADAALAYAQALVAGPLGGIDLALLGDEAKTQFEYDDRGLLTLSIDAENFSESYTYDAFGRRVTATAKSPTETVSAAGGTTTYQYNNRGQVVLETLPIKSYDKDGDWIDITSPTNPLGRVQNSYTYDALGNVIAKVEAVGLPEQRTTQYFYDELGRVKEIWHDQMTGAVTINNTTMAVSDVPGPGLTPKEKFEYDDNGNLVRTEDAAGGVTIMFYDQLNRKVAEISKNDAVSGTGTFSFFTYDANGNVIDIKIFANEVAMPSSYGTGVPAPDFPPGTYRQTTFSYDDLGRLKQSNVLGITTGKLVGASWVEDSDTTLTTAYEYDYRGNVVKLTDPNLNLVWSYYDGLGRKTAQVDAGQYLTTWEYNSEGNVLTERRYATQAAGTITAAAPPTVAVDSVNDRITEYTYDLVGNRTSEKRLNLLHENTGTTAVVNLSDHAVVEYTYNGLGQVTTKKEATGEVFAYEYDEGGRLRKETRPGFTNYTGAGTVTPQVEYTYDGLGNLTNTLEAGGGGVAARETRYEYGPGGLLKAVTAANGDKREYLYDVAGRVVIEHYDRSVMNTSTGATTTVHEGIGYRYDLKGRSLGQGLYTRSGSTWSISSAADYTAIKYNAFGDVVNVGTNRTANFQQTNLYDMAGRLIQTNAGDGVRKFLGYDKNGNQTITITDAGYGLGSMTFSQARAQIDQELVTATYVEYNSRNLVTKVLEEGRRLAAAPAGLVNIDTERDYNAFGEVDLEIDALENETEYKYNTAGRLIEIIRPQVEVWGENGQSQNLRPTEYLFYDKSGRLVAQKDANGNATQQTYLAGTGYGGSEGLVTQTLFADGGTKLAKYDVHGNARVLIDEIGRETEQTFDVLGRLTEKKDLNRKYVENTTTLFGSDDFVNYYTYDQLGRQIAHTNNYMVNTYGAGDNERTAYDIQGRITSSRAFGNVITNTTYQWDDSLAASLAGGGATPWGNTGGWIKETTYQENGTAVGIASGVTMTKMTEKSDLFGRAIQKRDFGTNITDYSYDVAGRLVKAAAFIESWYFDTMYQEYHYYNTGQLSRFNSIEIDVNEELDWFYDPYYPFDDGNGIGWYLIPIGTRSTTNDSGANYSYDAAGNRLTEYGSTTSTYTIVYLDSRPTVNGNNGTTTWKDITATYDALGRVSTLTAAATNKSAAASTVFGYDANGNIRKQQTSLRALDLNGVAAGTATVVENWFRYDSMNRVVLNNGTLVSGQIVRRPNSTTGALAAPQSQSFTYNLAGQRMSQTVTESYGSGYREVKDTYEYNDAGLLKTINQITGAAGTAGQIYSPPVASGTAILRSSYAYDLMGRQVGQSDYSTSGSTIFSSVTTYNSRGQLWTQTTDTLKTDNKIYRTVMTNDYGSGSTYRMGMVVSSTSASNVDNGAITNSGSTYAVTWRDAPVILWEDYDENTAPGQGSIYHTQYSYDWLGRLTSYSIDGPHGRTVNLTLDEYGQVLRRSETQSPYYTTSQPGNPHEVWYIFAGREFGYVGNNYTTEVTNAQSIADRQILPPTNEGSFLYGRTTPINAGEFSQSVDQINSFDQGSRSGAYTARGGESLRGLAQQLYGDASLWYKIADVNGLSGDIALTPGQVIQLPAGVTRNGYSADSFRPYDPMDALGSLSPIHVQPPKKKGCGIMGMILLAVIAIGVTIVTAGAALSVIAPTAFPTVGAGIGAVASGGLLGAAGGIGAAVGIGAASAAVGSIVSQGFGVLTGLQDSFSWKAVGMAALSGGVGAGMGTTFGSDWAAAGARGALSSAITQGIGVAAGLQDKFSWAGVAAAGVGAAAGHALSKGLDKGILGVKAGEHSFANFAASTAAGAIANAATRSAITGDSFGAALIAAIPDVVAQLFQRVLGDVVTAGGGDPAREMERNPSQQSLDKVRTWTSALEGIENVDLVTRKTALNLDTLKALAESGEFDPVVLAAAEAEAAFQGDMVSIATAQVEGGRALEPIMSVAIRLGGEPAGIITKEALSHLRTKDLAYIYRPDTDKGYKSSEFLKLAFNLLYETGSAVNFVDQKIRENVPLANWALEAVSLASGPAVWAAGKIIMASPLGNVVEDNVGRAANWLADKITGAGGNPTKVGLAASGAIFLGGLAFGAKKALSFFRDAKVALKSHFAAERASTRFIDSVVVIDRKAGKTLTGTVDLGPTLDRIKSGGSFPHRNDGSIFQNRAPRGASNPLLPAKPAGFYKEYVVPTPGVKGPGPQRIVVGRDGKMYYTPDHYDSFIPIN